jgi:hypothetical protein
VLVLISLLLHGQRRSFWVIISKTCSFLLGSLDESAHHWSIRSNFVRGVPIDHPSPLHEEEEEEDVYRKVCRETHTAVLRSIRSIKWINYDTDLTSVR